MKNILAENMLRFGVKNLTESQLNRIANLLVEQGSAITRPISTNEKIMLDQVKKVNGWSGTENIESFLKKNGIYFLDGVNAADFITLGYLRVHLAKLYNKFIKRPAKFQKASADLILKLNEIILTNMGPGGMDMGNAETFQFNESPDAPGKILTMGEVTESGKKGDYPDASYLEVICRWANTFNIMNQPKINPSGLDYEMGTPIFNTENPSYLDVQETFVTGEGDNRTYFWSLLGYTPAESDTTVTSTGGETLTVVGNESVAQTDAKYAPLAYAPDPAAIEKIVATLKDVQKIGELVDVTVIGSASTEKINMGTSKQGKKLKDYWINKKQPGAVNFVEEGNGMNGPKLPLDAAINGAGKTGQVKNPADSGNAFLATLRGNQIKQALKKAGIPVNFEYNQIAAGADARMIQVKFKVKKPDTNTVIPPKDVATTVGSGATRKEYGAVFQCRVADVDLF